MPSIVNIDQSGLFVSTTNVWDVQALASTDIDTPEFKELLVRLFQNVNNISLALNLKDTGYYSNINPYNNGQVWFPDPTLNSTTVTKPTLRQVYRIVIDFGALPNAGKKSVPHNLSLTSTCTFTRIYATASDTTNMIYIPIPFASTILVDNIQLDVDDINVNITTGINRTNYNICYVILEYIIN